MQKTVAVFGSSASRPGEPEYEAGVRCGQLLAEAGFAVSTGGYGGLMEAVSRGARSSGATVIGVTAPRVFPGRSGANAHVTEEVPTADLVERIGVLVGRSDASIALWGSIGTAAELLIAWNLAYVARFSGDERKPVIAVGDGWSRIVPMLEESLATDTGIVTVVDDVDAAVGILRTAWD